MTQSRIPTPPETLIADLMREKLQAAFSPQSLEVEDQSHMHAGHAGARQFGGGQSHYHIIMVAQSLEGLSRVARHRAVMDVLADEVARIHALSLDLKTA